MKAPAESPTQTPITSKQAVWSLVFGILSITCLWIAGSIPAIVFGILGIKKIDRSEGTLTGRGLAIAGIATGASGVFLGITPLAILASLLVPIFSGVGSNAKLTKQSSTIRSLISACKSHASDSNGEYPKQLADLLTENYLDMEDVLYWPPRPESERNRLPLLYSPGHSDASPPDQPLIAAPAPILGKRVVGFVGGNVKIVPELEFQEQYARHFP